MTYMHVNDILNLFYESHEVVSRIKFISQALYKDNIFTVKSNFNNIRKQFYCNFGQILGGSCSFAFRLVLD